MDRSIYTALNSMNILRDNQSVTAQNLANISVTGFQKDIQINFSSVYLDRDKGIDPRVMALQEPGGFDSTPGPMQQTGAPLDLAVDGNGFTSIGKTIKILPGMVAEADIVSGEKTVLKYLLQPVTKIANEAFRER